MSLFYQDLLEHANHVLQDQLLELNNADWSDLPLLECLAHNVAVQIQFIREIESDILDQEEHDVNS